MKAKNINLLLQKWYAVNRQFFLDNFKNYKSGKKELEFNPSLIDAMKKEYTPVFFLSTGRCGTQFIAEILKNNPKADVYHHARPELLFHQQMAYENPKSETTRALIDGARFELLFESFRRNRIFIETNNRLTFFAYALAQLFPNSKFVHIVRHPADFVISGMRRNWYTNKTLEDSGRLKLQAGNNWANANRFEKINGLWNETNLFIENFRTSVDPLRFHFVKAEDLFEKSENIITLANFCGMDTLNPEALIQKAKKPLNIQKSGTFKKYEHWSAEEKQQLKKYCSLAEKYNYTIK